MAEPVPWKSASAWSGIVGAARPSAGAGIVARPLEGLGVASVHARKGRRAELSARVKGLFGLEPPDGPRRAEIGPVAFVATGPGAWLAVNEGAAAGWADRLAVQFEGVVSVCDQSDGYAALNLKGPAVLEVLAKGVFLDLDPRAFPAGSAAGVSIAHIGVILWRRDALEFELLAFRSYADSLWHWVEESAAEFGLGVDAPAPVVA